MKNMMTLLLAASAAAVFSSQASAAEPFLSPRAKANQTATVVCSEGSASNSTRGQNTLGAAAKAKAMGSPSMVAGTPDASHGFARGHAAKTGSPRGLQQLRESGREFHVAPLK